MTEGVWIVCVGRVRTVRAVDCVICTADDVTVTCTMTSVNGRETAKRPQQSSTTA